MDSEFGHFIGHTFDNDSILAFNYYGLFKVSTGIISSHEKNSRRFPGIKCIRSPVINFASIIPSDMAKIDRNLFEGFTDFKKYIVQLRWKKIA